MHLKSKCSARCLALPHGFEMDLSPQHVKALWPCAVFPFLASSVYESSLAGQCADALEPSAVLENKNGQLWLVTREPVSDRVTRCSSVLTDLLATPGSTQALPFSSQAFHRVHTWVAQEDTDELDEADRTWHHLFSKLEVCILCT